jgi:hypothetical protein
LAEPRSRQTDRVVARPRIIARCRGETGNAQLACTDCTASSSSTKLGMCSFGTILRPVSTLTCGALLCRCVTSTARMTSKYFDSSPAAAVIQ